MKITHAIFDLDGTLIVSLPFWQKAYEDFLRQRGITPDEGLGQTVAKWTMKDISEYIKSHFDFKESAEQFAQAINERMKEIYFNMSEMKPGAREYLLKLKAEGVKMCVASGSANMLVVAALKNLGIYDLFDFAITCEEIGKSKTFPDIYEYCLEKLGANKDTTWVYEDAPSAVKTAKDLGLNVVGVADDYHDDEGKEEIKRYCDRYIDSFTELL
jgi:HAD superfamily hydrolase (TIGR01509 family)